MTQLTFSWQPAKCSEAAGCLAQWPDVDEALGHAPAGMVRMPQKRELLPGQLKRQRGKMHNSPDSGNTPQRVTAEVQAAGALTRRCCEKAP